MAGGSSGKRRSRGLFLDSVDTLTSLGLKLGGAAFILFGGYLLWGMLAGPLSHVASLTQADRARIVDNVVFACRVLTASGIALLVSAAIRFYSEEVTGYILLIGGALLQWGMPMMMGSSLERASLGTATLSVYIINSFRLVGIVALVAAVPFIAADFSFKLRGIRRGVPRGAVVVSREVEPRKSRLHIFCWQMPYCREYLRAFCKAYQHRKSCWRTKSGCYCDEEMILRMMKRSKTSKLPGFDQRYTEVAGGSKDLTPAQKRQRCRQCFLYAEHQKQKYQILSPLTFPAAIAVMWVYFEPTRAILRKALEFTDRFAGRISFEPWTEQLIGNQWANAPSTSSTVEYLFLICIGLIVVTYLLRGLEYFIFEVQV